MLSVIIPSFNENENIRRTAGTIAAVLRDAGIEYELLFVDDGSRDSTWAEICAAHEFDPCVRGLGFSRNFGKEGAIFAGLKNAAGDCAVVIDCDLQHPPELIPEMYSLWQGGAEVVEAVKRSRGREGLFHKLFARSFYKMMKSSSGINLDGASDFKLLDRKVINALNELPERITFFRALSSWVGFATERVEFDVQPRAARQEQVQHEKPVPVCAEQYHIFYGRAHQADILGWGDIRRDGCDSRYPDPGEVLLRSGCGGILHRYPADTHYRCLRAAGRRRDRILPLQDLRGDKAAPEVYNLPAHRRKGAP